MTEVKIPVPGKLQKTRSEPLQLRRSSTCILDSKTNEANALPNYLRASIGSCHDLCKFGFKHDFNTIESTPMVKGFRAAPKKSREPAKDDIALLENKSSFNTTPSTLGTSTRQSKRKETQLSTTRKGMNPKLTEELKQKPLRSKESFISTTEQVKQRNTEISTLKGASGSTGQKSALSTGKGARNPKTNKEISSLSRERDAISVPKKRSHLKGNNNIISQASTGFLTRKPDAKIAPRKLSYLRNINSQNKARVEKSNVEDVPEKIIYVIETNTQNCKDLSSEEKEKEKQEKEKEKQDPSLVLLPEVEELIVPAPQKIGTISANEKASDGKDHQSQSPRKLKFGKGKGIEIQTEKNNAGRRLTFRQAKLLDHENQHKNPEPKRKKSSRKQDTECVSNATTNEVNEIVLRPQDPKEREYAESLYDNVIKETARKLVKTQKSKVRALVGAFETIISLQDEKSQGKTKA